MSKKKAPRSLFFHLVFILILTAISIIFIVFGFFHLMRKETINRSIKSHLKQYTSYLASDLGEPPDANKIKELEKNLNLHIIYRPYDLNEIKPEASKYLPPQNIFFRIFHNFQKGDYYREGWYPGHFVKKYRGKKGEFLFIVNAPDSLGIIPKPVIILILIILSGFIFSWLILRNLMLPLKKMENAFEQASKGDFSQILDLKRPREFARIGHDFNAMLTSIKKLFDGRQQMLLDVSHDLRTPLTRMKLNLGFISKSKEKTAIEDDIRIMDNLLSDIIESYKLSDGRDKLQLTVFDIRGLTQKLIKAFRSSSSNKKIKMVATGADWLIHADKNKLTRMFSNLMDNAIKYAPLNSVIQIVISNDLDGFKWTIENAGEAISESHRDRIFEPFFQADPARNPSRSGFGLGLYICQKIAWQHGGGIEYTRVPGGGSLFSVRLPHKKFNLSNKPPR